ncbi:MAG: D-alanine--D-alanine ligase [Tannerella sp.]|jgi:D-alanine-D-alanine ligase|nr:D-alanine--D-alanine ligase [Tannerella sp.]
MKHIAIVAGGDSSEYEVSLRSADGIYGFIDENRYHRYIVILRNSDWKVKMPDGAMYDIDKNDFSFRINGQKIKFDYAYITIHGRPGEDGRLQGYFDMLGVPYSSCGVLTCALTCNKYMNNRFLKSFGYCVPDSIHLPEGRKADVAEIINRLGLPVFVKPNDGGSSFGVTKVKDAAQLQQAVEKAFSEGREVIIEPFVEGREVTCGCYKTKTKQLALPITEVITDNEFFDYDAKYNGRVEEITPAHIPDDLAGRIQRQTLEIYDVIGAHGIIRIDYIIPADNHPVLLEINTTPGMTSTSFIPQQIRAAGLDIKDVMTEIIENG